MTASAACRRVGPIPADEAAVRGPARMADTSRKDP